jgi:small subunit ribosomal protein S16
MRLDICPAVTRKKGHHLAVRIRLTRVGATKRPSYRVVAIDSRRPRDGRSLEILGFYDPLTDPATVQIDAERLNAWIAKGALPSETVGKLMRQAGIGSDAAAAPATEAKPARAAAKTTRTRKAPAKAAATAKE